MTLKVLIVEDEWLIALDHASILRDAGHEVVGPVATVDGALELIANTPIDLALVDHQLGGDTSGVLIERLTQAGTHIIVATGHNPKDLPQALAELPTIGKPIDGRNLLALVERLED